MIRKTIGCGAVAFVLTTVLLILNVGTLNSQQSSKSRVKTDATAKPEKKQSPQTGKPTAKSKTKLTKTQKIIELLNQNVDLSVFQRLQEIYLGKFVLMLADKLKTKDNDIAIIVDRRAFSVEDPDAPAIAQTPVDFFHDHRPRMPLATVLRLAVAQYPTGNATFLVRRGMIEITTEHQASPEMLLAHKVTASFAKRPLREVLQTLSEQSGASIVIDPRLGEKADAPMTATFAHNVSLEAALITLTDTIGLKMVPLGRSLYITTPENAKKLQCERKRLQKKLKNEYRPSLDPFGGGIK